MVVNEESDKTLRERTRELEGVGGMTGEVGVGWPREAHKGSNDEEHRRKGKEKGKLHKEREESNGDDHSHSDTKVIDSGVRHLWGER